MYEITMIKQKFLQNGEKTTSESEKKNIEGATTKEKDDEKNDGTISQQEEHQND